MNVSDATKRALLKMAEDNLGNAQDNLYRSQIAGRGRDLDEQYGQSGQTLREIQEDYQRWVDEAQAVVNELKGGGA